MEDAEGTAQPPPTPRLAPVAMAVTIPDTVEMTDEDAYGPAASGVSENAADNASNPHHSGRALDGWSLLTGESGASSHRASTPRSHSASTLEEAVVPSVEDQHQDLPQAYQSEPSHSAIGRRSTIDGSTLRPRSATPVSLSPFMMSNSLVRGAATLEAAMRKPHPTLSERYQWATQMFAIALDFDQRAVYSYAFDHYVKAEKCYRICREAE